MASGSGQGGQRRTWRGRIATRVAGLASVLGLAAALLGPVTAPASAAVLPAPAVSYVSFDGAALTRVPWEGRNVALLLPTDYPAAPDTMERILGALDRAYEYYVTVTGRTPSPYRTVDGRLSIAVVPSACGGRGSGCGYLGATGIEIESAFFDKLYVGVRDRGAFDQVLFYELGRNFWFYSPQLEYRSPQTDPVVTGYAVLMRLRSMTAAGVVGDDFYNGTSIPWPQFVAMIRGIVTDYEANTSETWASTLAQGLSPSVLGGTDFFASIMLRLADLYGGDAFLGRFFHLASNRPAAVTTVDAVTTMVSLASQAACTDLGPVFYRRWSFPDPAGAAAPRTDAAATPMPPAVPCPTATVPPTAPALVTVARGLGQARVSWAPPEDAGTDAVSRYRVQRSTRGSAWGDAGLLIGGSARSLVVNRLANGVTYRFRVQAGSAAGWGAWSKVVAVTPGAVPGPVRSLVAAFPRPRLTVLRWSRPVRTWSMPLRGYQVRVTPNGGRSWSRWVLTGPANLSWRGLVQGRLYLVQVRALNVLGAGPIAAIRVRPSR